MFSALLRSGLRLLLVGVVTAIAGESTQSVAFAQGGGGALGGLFRSRANANLGYYPYYGYSPNPGYNIYGNYGVYGYPGSQIEGGAGNAGYDPGYGGYPSYDGYGLINRPSSPPPTVGSVPGRRPLLGIDEEPVVLSDGAKAIKISKVYPSTPAEKAGLKSGDIILSINGYLTEQRGNLAWVIANAMPAHELKLNVQAADGGKTQVLTATLP